MLARIALGPRPRVLQRLINDALEHRKRRGAPTLKEPVTT